MLRVAGVGTLLSGVAGDHGQASSYPKICCGDHRCSSFSSTIAANPGSRESFVGFERCARDHAAR
jgi:hypothetical protein